ncbi:cerebellin 20 [Pseudochaenichthys georgianus]|uniref:cerebellin 20 n=1 Tax=Pseudochaenichthys georgianus TaxID=52239 RepID=UPI00146B3354|nr:complement C1q-like protein 3 [Pseudochaenichthys georgianus]
MYAWRGQVVDSKTENAGLTDQGSCGCYVMQQQIQRMKMFFNTSLTELEQELTKTKNILNDIRVSINLGDSYSTETGIFTVPRSRVYSLALTVYSDAGAPGNTLAACASLQVSGLVVARSKDRNMQDQEDSATIVVALHLNAGDKVAVNLPIGCFLCDDNSHYNTFTGFLLYAMIKLPWDL